MTGRQIESRAAMALGLLLVSFGAGIGTGWAQYPSVPQITKDGTTVLLQDYASLPQSSRTTANPPPPIDYTGQLARVNFLRSEPTAALASGSRFFVNDLNRNLYILDKTTRQFTPYINFEAVFPKFDNDPGHAAGLVTFAFDPNYAINGKLYSVHTEDPAKAGSAVPTNAGLPGLDLSAGYTTTMSVDPPVGAVVRQAVLVEWSDTDPNDSTFVGTAREILRVGFNGNIHPMGDLLFNPLADSGNADYGNLYIAVGDGSAGETADAVHSIPQRLDALQGKILRITPDINLRPADALGPNGRYRIPTTGPDPNPFISLILANLKKEIYAYGLRNPHRMSWDLMSNKLIVDDIGLNAWEEINIVTKGSNYGYAEREGTEQLFVGGPNNGKTGSQTSPTTAFPGSDFLTVTGIATPVTPVYPAAQYSHPDGNAISSGFVYRGSLSNLYGKYIFGDIAKARLFVADLTDLIVNDDGSRTSVATIHELQVVYDSPYDIPDQGPVNRDLHAVVGDEHARKIGSGGAQLRADIRLALGGDGELYVLSKSDGMIRQFIPQAPALPTVTVIATDQTATEAGITTGTFTFSRTGSTAAALSVNYTVSGAATVASDYVALTGSVTIPAAAASATITVTPINDTYVEPSETVVVTLSPNGTYSVGSPDVAVVTIVSDDQTTTTTVSGSPNPSNYLQTVTFTATVTAAGGGAGTPTGTVAFTEGSTALGSVLVDGTGRAILNLSNLSPGSHTITATFVGSGGWLNSAGTTTQTVNGVPPNQVTGVSATSGPAKRAITVKWSATSDPDDAVAAYLVYSSSSQAGSYTLLATVTTLSYVNTLTSSGTERWYYVVARDTAGNLSVPSAKVSAKSK